MDQEKIRRGDAGRFLGNLSKLEAKRRRDEDALQKAAFQWCKFCLPRNVLSISIPNERMPDNMLGRMMAMGLRPGAADFLIVHEGRAHWVEFKSKDGVQSDSQERFEIDATRAGSPYRIVRSLDAFTDALTQWGIPSSEVRR